MAVAGVGMLAATDMVRSKFDVEMTAIVTIMLVKALESWPVRLGLCEIYSRHGECAQGF